MVTVKTIGFLNLPISLAPCNIINTQVSLGVNLRIHTKLILIIFVLWMRLRLGKTLITTRTKLARAISLLQ